MIFPATGVTLTALHHLFSLQESCQDLLHPHSRFHFTGLVHTRFGGALRVKCWNFRTGQLHGGGCSAMQALAIRCLQPPGLGNRGSQAWQSVVAEGGVGKLLIHPPSQQARAGVKCPFAWEGGLGLQTELLNQGSL